MNMLYISVGETSNGRNTDTVIALRFLKLILLGGKKTCLEVVSGLCPSSLDVEFSQGIGRWLFNEPTGCATKERGGWCLFSDQRGKKK